MMKGIWTLLAPAVVAALLATACQTVQTTQPGAVGIERKQSMLVSSADINQAAVQSYRETMQKAAAKGALNRDPAQVERVRRIANRLIPTTATFRPDAPSWKWETNVVSDDDVNAWVMPGGKIAVYSGLLEKLKPSDDELAAILGHEMAHALREHARERASQAIATGIGVSIVGAAAGLGDAGVDLVGLLADLTFTRPNSRLHETEADRIGVELAARAGYDPRAAVTLWQKMGKLSGGSPPQWLSTHPSHETRTRDLENYAARVMPLYERTRSK